MEGLTERLIFFMKAFLPDDWSALTAGTICLELGVQLAVHHPEWAVGFLAQLEREGYEPMKPIGEQGCLRAMRIEEVSECNP